MSEADQFLTPEVILLVLADPGHAWHVAAACAAAYKTVLAADAP